MSPVTAVVAASNSPLNNRHDFLVVNGWARHTAWLHGFMKLYAGDGVALFALFLVIGWWLARRSDSPRQMATALWAGLGTLAAVGVNQPITPVGAEYVVRVMPRACIRGSRHRPGRVVGLGSCRGRSPVRDWA